jgi:hypothetical protein
MEDTMSRTVLALALLGSVGLLGAPAVSASSREGQKSGHDQNDRYVRDDKITLCHYGKNTITVDRPAAPAHFAHGDGAGVCAAVSSIE